MADKKKKLIKEERTLTPKELKTDKDIENIYSEVYGHISPKKQSNSKSRKKETQQLDIGIKKTKRNKGMIDTKSELDKISRSIWRAKNPERHGDSHEKVMKRRKENMEKTTIEHKRGIARNKEMRKDFKIKSNKYKNTIKYSTREANNRYSRVSKEDDEKAKLKVQQAIQAQKERDHVKDKDVTKMRKTQLRAKRNKEREFQLSQSDNKPIIRKVKKLKYPQPRNDPPGLGGDKLAKRSAWRTPKLTKPSVHTVNVHRDNISKIKKEIIDNNSRPENTDLPDNDSMKPKKPGFLGGILGRSSKNIAPASGVSQRKPSLHKRLFGRARSTLAEKQHDNMIARNTKNIERMNIKQQKNKEYLRKNTPQEPQNPTLRNKLKSKLGNVFSRTPNNDVSKHNVRPRGIFSNRRSLREDRNAFIGPQDKISIPKQKNRQLIQKEMPQISQVSDDVVMANKKKKRLIATGIDPRDIDPSKSPLSKTSKNVKKVLSNVRQGLKEIGEEMEKESFERKMKDFDKPVHTADLPKPRGLQKQQKDSISDAEYRERHGFVPTGKNKNYLKSVGTPEGRKKHLEKSMKNWERNIDRRVGSDKPLEPEKAGGFFDKLLGRKDTPVENSLVESSNSSGLASRRSSPKTKKKTWRKPTGFYAKSPKYTEIGKRTREEEQIKKGHKILQADIKVSKEDPLNLGDDSLGSSSSKRSAWRTPKMTARENRAGMPIKDEIPLIHPKPKPEEVTITDADIVKSKKSGFLGGILGRSSKNIAPASGVSQKRPSFRERIRTGMQSAKAIRDTNRVAREERKHDNMVARRPKYVDVTESTKRNIIPRPAPKSKYVDVTKETIKNITPRPDVPLIHPRPRPEEVIITDADIVKPKVSLLSRMRGGAPTTGSRMRGGIRNAGTRMRNFFSRNKQQPQSTSGLLGGQITKGSGLKGVTRKSNSRIRNFFSRNKQPQVGSGIIGGGDPSQGVVRGHGIADGRGGQGLITGQGLAGLHKPIPCPFCGRGQIPPTGGVCPSCKNMVRGTGSGNVMPKMFNAYNFAKYRFKQKMLETAILWILAILAAVTFNYIFFSIAILTYSFYIIFPSEKAIMMDAKKHGRQVYACPICGQTMGQYGGIQQGMGMMGMGQIPQPPQMPPGGWGCGHNQPLVLRTESKMTQSNLDKLIIRSMLKIFVIIFTIVEFGFVHPQNGPVTMIMLFGLYFWLPLSYFTGKISGAVESWFRMFFAIPLGMAMVGFLNPNGASSLILNGFMVLTQNLPQLLFSIVPLSVMFAFAMARDRKMEEKEGINKNYYMLAGAFGFTLIFWYFFRSVIDSLFVSGNYVQMSMFYLVLAFFMTAPNRKISTEAFDTKGLKFVLNIKPDDIQNLYAKIKDGSGSMWLVQTSMYYAFVIQAGLPIIADLTAGAAKELMYITAAIWILSTLVGAAPGARTTRPYIGVMLIIFSLILFSFQYTGTIGTAVFGQWWPSVYSVGSGVMEPIGDAFESIGETMEDYSLMASCYDCWVAKQERLKQEQQGLLARGKTTRALELENFNAVNYETLEPNIDPMLPLIGDAEITNKGDFDAETIIITIGDLQTYDPLEVSAADSNAGKNELRDECIFTYCSGELSDNKRICYLLESLYPSDKVQITFECGDPTQNYLNWSSGGSNDLLTCQCAKYREKKDAIEQQFGADAGSSDECTWKTSPMDSCSESAINACTSTEDPVCGKRGIVSYTKARWMIEIPIRYQFEYSVSSALSVDVMTRSLFDNLDEQPREKDSEYSGGPIKLSVWTQNQPLRSDSTSFGKLSVLNTGKGKLLEGTEVYANIETPDGLEITDLEITSVIGMRECMFDEMKIICELGETLEKDDSANVLFRFNVNLKEPVQQKTFTITGNIDNYVYNGEKDIELPISSAPAFQ
jgi:hypothetical protein